MSGLLKALDEAYTEKIQDPALALDLAMAEKPVREKALETSRIVRMVTKYIDTYFFDSATQKKTEADITLAGKKFYSEMRERFHRNADKIYSLALVLIEEGYIDWYFGSNGLKFRIWNVDFVLNLTGPYTYFNDIWVKKTGAPEYQKYSFTNPNSLLLLWKIMEFITNSKEFKDFNIAWDYAFKAWGERA